MILILILIIFLITSGLSFFSGKYSKKISTVSVLSILFIFIVYSFYLFKNYNGNFISYSNIMLANYSVSGITFELSFSSALSGLTDTLVIMALSVTFFAVILGRKEYDSEFYGLIMLSGTGLFGLFISRNFLFFYIFWETILIPIFFLISRYGKNNKEKSAMKFFIYMHVGSLFLLLSIFTLALFYFYDFHIFTFQIGLLMQYNFIKTIPEFYTGFILFGFLLAFFVKLPSFPLHAWLPDAHTDAPYSASVMLSGALLPMGAYGLLGILYPIHKIFPLLLIYFLIGLGIFSLIYLTLVAMAQNNLKRMVAYASASDMSFITISFATSMLTHGYTSVMDLSGGMYQIIGHSFVVALLFGSLAFLQRRTGSIEKYSLRGINREMPYLSFFLIAGMVGSMGMPPFSEFIGELSIIISSFQPLGLLSILIIIQIILATGYMTHTIQYSIFGIFNEHLVKLRDINSIEIVTLSIILAGSIILGVFPTPIFHILALYSSSIS